MSRVFLFRNTVFPYLAAVLLALVGAPCAYAVEQARLDTLYAQLQQADDKEAQTIAAEIELELSRSGSPSADLLLKRGRDALEQGNAALALEHLTALTDHAPDFAQGWFERAQAFIMLDQPGQAFSDLEHALLIEPRHFAALAQLASLLEELKMEKLSLEAYEQVHQLYPQLTLVNEALDRLRAKSAGKAL